MQIGELARQAGMTVQGVRFYERRGLMPQPPRTDAGYRVYSAAGVRRLQFIRQAKRLGFSLQEIVRILTLRQRGACPCEEVVETLQRHLRETEEQLMRLERFRAELARTLKQWKHTGRPEVPGEIICGLIERTIQPRMAGVHEEA